MVMSVWYLIVAVSIIAGTLFVIWIASVEIQVTYASGNSAQLFSIKGKAFGGLVRFAYELPRDQPHDGLAGLIKNLIAAFPGDTRVRHGKESRRDETGGIRDFLDKVKTGKTALEAFSMGLERLARGSRIERFEWHTELGTQDAASTGILSGLTWAVKGMLVSAASRRTNLKSRPGISVTPRFDAAAYSTRFNCILKTRLGHIISAGMRSLFFLVMKRGKALWKTSIRFKDS